MKREISFLITSTQNAPGKISLTFDGWSDAILRAYIAVTIHYVDENWALISDLLSFAELPGSHSGEHMAEHLYDVLGSVGGTKKVRNVRCRSQHNTNQS